MSLLNQAIAQIEALHLAVRFHLGNSKTMHIRLFNKRDLLEQKRVFQIQQQAYAVEAKILGVSTFPPLNETLEDLQRSTDEGLVAFVDEKLAGAIFLEKKENFVLISKLVVDPGFFRRGVGQSLVERSLKLYPKNPFHVRTGALNKPAIELYKKFGFKIAQERMIDDSLKIVLMKRDPF